MASSGGQISSLHLAVAAGGGVLLYAALRGVSPLQALKDVTSGAPPAVSTEGKQIKGADGSVDPDYLPGGTGTAPWKGGPYKLRKGIPARLQTPALFVAAAQTHAAEKYSQSQRWARGYADCASFVGKALLDIGLEPPGGSTTGDYAGSADWMPIAGVSQPRLGDVAVNNRHMIICTDGAHGIGMQNSRRNVQRDTIDNLMANTGSWEIRRFKRWW
jgi:hypothetical protein